MQVDTHELGVGGGLGFHLIKPLIPSTENIVLPTIMGQEFESTPKTIISIDPIMFKVNPHRF